MNEPVDGDFTFWLSVAMSATLYPEAASCPRIAKTKHLNELIKAFLVPFITGILMNLMYSVAAANEQEYWMKP